MTIGWYVHHHGRGHVARLLACAPHLGPLAVFSSAPAPAGLAPNVRWTPLDDDRARRPADPSAGGALHWAPIGHNGHRRRMARIAAAAEDEGLSAFVVDVSVEVAVLSRLLGVPTAVVAQRGRRTDAPHALAYRMATAVIAPWTPGTHQPGDGLPDDDRLRFVGALSRFDGRPASGPPRGRDVLVLIGGGGHRIAPAEVAAAAAATPGWRWHVAGALRVTDPRVTDHGPEADVWALLGEAAVVAGTAGANTVAEIAAARRPYVCLPQARPFDEQERQAEALATLAPVVVRRDWPAPSSWPRLLEDAALRDVRGWSALHDGGSADRLTAVVKELAR